ncbi:MAG TPA: hypothetical protein VFK47_18180, partial [Ktedonobacteraceae bacterium]|nr:hypothetical protein [Ktedonobacteraceae bacterium]
MSNTVRPADMFFARASGSEVSINMLPDPPGREGASNPSMFYLFDQAMQDTPRSDRPSWEPEDFSRRRGPIHAVRMNSCGVATFRNFGLLATGNLNGCTAVAASYQDKRSVPTFVGHYDTEAIRQTGRSGDLKINELLSRFIGERVADIVIAYSKKANRNLAKGTGYDPEYFPLDAMIDTCRGFSKDSRVLLLPYENNRNVQAAQPHLLYAGYGAPGAGPYFGWNGHPLEVRPPDNSAKSQARLRQAMDQLRAQVLAEQDADDLDLGQFE